MQGTLPAWELERLGRQVVSGGGETGEMGAAL